MIGWVSSALVSAAALIAPVDPSDRDEAIAAARASFEDAGSMPWYDREKDVLQPVPVAVRADYDLEWLFKPLFWLFVIVIVLLAAGLAWLIVRAISMRNRRVATDTAEGALTELTADGVEALPFLGKRSRDDLLGQARRHYEQGNYAEAIVYLFSYELVALDKSSLVQLASGKTNRQYLRELAGVQPLGRLLEQTMLAFEDVFFGGRSLDRTAFEACWNQLDRFENLVSQAAAP